MVYLGCDQWKFTEICLVDRGSTVKRKTFVAQKNEPAPQQPPDGPTQLKPSPENKTNFYSNTLHAPLPAAGIQA